MGCSSPSEPEVLPVELTQGENMAIKAIKCLQDELKDPPSMRIYDDILVQSFDNSSIEYTIYITYDAKNSYGGYSGKERAEINMYNGHANINYEDDSWHDFTYDTIDTFDNLDYGSTIIEYYTYYRIDGEIIANELELEYID